eukprot:9490448-Pyramimonas_sp.AAC.1
MRNKVARCRRDARSAPSPMIERPPPMAWPVPKNPAISADPHCQALLQQQPRNGDTLRSGPGNRKPSPLLSPRSV